MRLTVILFALTACLSFGGDVGVKGPANPSPEATDSAVESR